MLRSIYLHQQTIYLNQQIMEGFDGEFVAAGPAGPANEGHRARRYDVERTTELLCMAHPKIDIRGR